MRTAAQNGNRWHGLLLSLCALALAGCATSRSEFSQAAGPMPANVYQAGNRLPKEFRRVAVLPVTAVHADSISEWGREALQPVLYSELGKANAFELAFVTAEQLRQWTGRSDWAAADKLPANFFVQLREQSGCDAVLFCQLTQFRAYPPLAVGWNLKLVDAVHPRIWWAVDEAFDAGIPSVASGARGYYSKNRRVPTSLADSCLVQYSPRQFGQYTAHAMVALLPQR